MFYDEAGTFLFVDIPGTGGDAVLRAVQAAGVEGLVIEPGHPTAAEACRRVPYWRERFKFAVARNPVEIIAGLYETDGMERGFTLEEYVRNVLPLIVPAGGFWRTWCLGQRGHSLGVRPMRHHFLNRDWRAACEMIGLKYHRLEADDFAPGADWTDELLDEVAAICQDDIYRFDYGTMPVME